MSSSSSSLGKRAIAVLVLLLAAWILLKVLIGIAVAVFWVVLAVAALVAIVWAIRVL
jgi:hypothetical protein